jgi:hypothetical protein
MSLGHRPDDTGATVPPQALVHRLRELDEEMPEALHTQLLAAGVAVVPDLLAVLEEVLADDQVDYGWAPLHAAELLGRLVGARAVPVLLRCLEWCDVLDLFHKKVSDVLVALGEPAIDECLEAYATTTDDDLRDSLAHVLSQCATHDERIYAVLLDTLERSPELGAMYLAEYGDPRAIPALSQRFDALPISDEDSPLANHVFVELRVAIEDLGGQLTAEQAAKAERAEASGRRFVAQMEGLMRRIFGLIVLNSLLPYGGRIKDFSVRWIFGNDTRFTRKIASRSGPAQQRGRHRVRRRCGLPP